ncbi:MAG: hypothetical protein DRP06_01645 [Candidatus Aenigmatarchaeota archaeon]|nr:MAG: hypothetical protein DRP06_01645 [Candidatus Aenigmarchaeota archaeon]
MVLIGIYPIEKTKGKSFKTPDNAKSIKINITKEEFNDIKKKSSSELKGFVIKLLKTNKINPKIIEHYKEWQFWVHYYTVTKKKKLIGRVGSFRGRVIF